MCITEVNNKGISTFGRYLYLNIYAFLLILIGGGVMSISFVAFSIPLLVVQLCIFFCCIKGAASILGGAWQAKKKKYEILMSRNQKEFRSDTFEEFMMAPCGRLLVRLVLADLRQKDKYSLLLSKYRPSILKQIKTITKPSKTRVVIHSNSK